MEKNLEILLNPAAETEAAISAESALRKEYPAFVLPTELLLRYHGAALPPELQKKALQRIAIFCSDSLALSRLENPEKEFENFYPPVEKQATPTTEDAIATFLDTYGGADAGSDKEVALLEKLIFNPVPQDYAETLRKEGDSSENVPHDLTIERIDSFISAHPDPRGDESPAPQCVSQHPEPAPEAAANTLLSESLAKIYIKQHRYDKAFEIISQLSLNYPEKSVYFADQLRFLRKLLLIESYRKRKNNISTEKKKQ